MGTIVAGSAWREGPVAWAGVRDLRLGVPNGGAPYYR